jgi:hypothetical protein
LPLRARTADAILRLMGGRNKQASVNHDADSPAAVPVPATGDVQSCGAPPG